MSDCNRNLNKTLRIGTVPLKSGHLLLCTSFFLFYFVYLQMTLTLRCTLTLPGKKELFLNILR